VTAGRMRYVAGHVKIHEMKVVNTQGKAAFTENTGKGISRYSLFPVAVCVFSVRGSISQEMGPNVLHAPLVHF
jgi:NifB/MoaA-like Fe-S oxidoreductase